ncbi:MAG: type IV pilus biogenesis protein PilM [Candidatus Anammoxibacter sp.]
MSWKKHIKPDNTAIGIEVTSSQIKLVEADVSVQPIKILNFVSIDILSPYPDNIAQQIKAIVESKEFTTKSANIATAYPSIIHQLIYLPPMPKDEMSTIVEREVKGMTHSEEELRFDWQMTGEVKEKGGKKKEILLVAAPSEAIDEKATLIEGTGLSCKAITTVPLALLNSLQFIQDGDKGAIAFLFLGVDRGYLLFARGGKWFFSREFAHEDEGYKIETVLTEVNRSRRYFKQHYRNEDIDRIIISGDTKEDLEPFEKGLDENLGMKAERFVPTRGLDLAAIEGKVKEWYALLPGFPIVLGLLKENPHHNLPNLATRQIKEKASVHRKRLVAVALPAILLFVFIVSYGKLYLNIRSHKAGLKQSEIILKRFQPTRVNIENVTERKYLYDKFITFQEHLDKIKVPWADMFLRLSQIVPDEMVLNSFQAERIKGGWQSKISGTIMAPYSYALQKSFNLFYSGFKTYPLFSQIELAPLNIGRTMKEVKSVDGGKIIVSKEEQSKADFEIKFMIKEMLQADAAVIPKA